MRPALAAPRTLVAHSGKHQALLALACTRTHSSTHPGKPGRQAGTPPKRDPFWVRARCSATGPRTHPFERSQASSTACPQASSKACGPSLLACRRSLSSIWCSVSSWSKCDRYTSVSCIVLYRASTSARGGGGWGEGWGIGGVGGLARGVGWGWGALTAHKAPYQCQTRRSAQHARRASAPPCPDPPLALPHLCPSSFLAPHFHSRPPLQ